MERWGLFRKCGECEEPTDIFSICSYLGHNPGVDGHLFRSEQDAKDAMELFLERLMETPFKDRDSDFWTEYPFSSIEEERDWLQSHIHILPVVFPSL